MSLSKEKDPYRDFAAGVFSVWDPLKSNDPILPPPPYTLYTCIQYTYSHKKGEGGRANQRKGKTGNSLRKLVENINMTDCISSL